jgi:hypothetical protein
MAEICFLCYAKVSRIAIIPLMKYSTSDFKHKQLGEALMSFVAAAGQHHTSSALLSITARPYTTLSKVRVTDTTEAICPRHIIKKLVFKIIKLG